MRDESWMAVAAEERTNSSGFMVQELLSVAEQGSTTKDQEFFLPILYVIQSQFDIPFIKKIKQIKKMKLWH